MKASDSQGNLVDHFYYGFTGYKRPAGELGNNFFWSSSLYLSSPAFYMEGESGWIDFLSRESTYRGHYSGDAPLVGAVRCVE